VFGTGIIKVNNFSLKDVALVDKLRYNLLSVSQLVDANLNVLFRKSGSKVLDSRGNLVVFLASGMFFKLIFILLNPLQSG
jgi:hypothetical protein